MVLRGIFGLKREEVRGAWCRREYLDPRGRKREKDIAGGNVWTEEGGSERRMVLRGIFGPKREEVREG